MDKSKFKQLIIIYSSCFI